jgi:hypothetical protein
MKFVLYFSLLKSLSSSVYKAFLEILHRYHREQHTIKDVYSQVCFLKKVESCHCFGRTYLFY